MGSEFTDQRTDAISFYKLQQRFLHILILNLIITELQLKRQNQGNKRDYQKLMNFTDENGQI